MNVLHRVLFSVIVTSSLAQPWNEPCKPQVNCKLPDCRCWDDPARPGDIKIADTPQMILMAFSRGLTNWTTEQYLKLFQGHKNPNGCPPKGTFFSEDSDAQVGTLARLHWLGHEVALTPSSNKTPVTQKDWLNGLLASSKKLLEANISLNQLKGVQGFDNAMGGDNEMKVMTLMGMKYDAGCVVQTYNSKRTLWPYTYNFVDNLPKCKLGKTPTVAYPGLWEFPIPEISFKGHNCSILSACSSLIRSKADAFTLLYNAFETHYYFGRTPMIINVDSTWINGKFQFEGLKEFLDIVGRYDDIWMVSMTQALDWMQSPLDADKSKKFGQWGC